MFGYEDDLHQKLEDARNKIKALYGALELVKAQRNTILSDYYTMLYSNYNAVEKFKSSDIKVYDEEINKVLNGDEGEN